MLERNVPKLLTPDQVADLLGVTPHTLAVWRCQRRYDLPYAKVGRAVRYRASDVADFIARNVFGQDDGS